MPSAGISAPSLNLTMRCLTLCQAVVNGTLAWLEVFQDGPGRY